jgi:sulfatase maturation enzyme AslB (radical SAM superfamily)
LQDSIVYNITAQDIDDYQGHNLIVRSGDPNELADSLKRIDPETLRFIQLISSSADSSVLENTAIGVPIEIILENPASDFARLYSYTNLLDTHPVRIAIPVEPGFSKAVKAAVSLNFAVKLETGQPTPELIEELEAVLDLYLHRSNVRQPVQFFQSALLSFYRGEPMSLWSVAEEDPAEVIYINDSGQKTISRRFSDTQIEDLEDFVDGYVSKLLSEKRECFDCEYFSRCGGYFKWPDASYDCAGVKKLFRTLKVAAAELKQDLAAHQDMEVQHQS